MIFCGRCWHQWRSEDGATVCPECGWDSEAPKQPAASNGHVPREHPVYSFEDMSRGARGWGRRYETLKDAVKDNLWDKFSLVDRGSLLRIAEATEKSVECLESLQRLVKAALRPALAAAYEQGRRIQSYARKKLRELLVSLEARHGPCPEELFEGLLCALMKEEPHLVLAIERGYGVNFAGNIVSYEAAVDWNALQLPKVRKNSRLGKSWAAWQSCDDGSS